MIRSTLDRLSPVVGRVSIMYRSTCRPSGDRHVDRGSIATIDRHLIAGVISTHDPPFGEQRLRTNSLRNLNAQTLNTHITIYKEKTLWSFLAFYRYSFFEGLREKNQKLLNRDMWILNGWPNLDNTYADIQCKARLPPWTSKVMFDELAERSLTSPLPGRKHTYVRLAIIIHCKILALSLSLWMAYYAIGNAYVI